MQPAPNDASTAATCRLRFACELAAIRDVARQAREFFTAQRIGEHQLIGLELALVEACNNAVLYVREDAKGEPVQAEFLCDDKSIEIQIADHCRDFDWPEKVDLPDDENEHGRGLYIIHSVMDEVVYLKGKKENRLIMRQERRGASETPRAAATELDDSKKSRTSRGSSTGARESVSAPPLETNWKNSGSPPSENLETVQEKLALSEQVIGAMAKEICFRSEELAAIFRSTSELGRTTRIESFSERLLEDLLRITAADWFVLRLGRRRSAALAVTNCSRKDLTLAVIEPDQNADSGEARAAATRKDFFFDSLQPVLTTDPLADLAGNGGGMIRPIVLDGALLGTLAIGQKKPYALTREQVQVIQTFTDFLAVHVLNARLQQEQVDSEITARELDIARNIQQSLLPIKFPRIHGFGLSGFCLSARQVGGDFYDVLPLGENKLLLIVADVMGKGVPAAMFAATLHTLVRTMAEWTVEPSELLARVNRFMYQELAAVDMFITVQLALIDISADKLIVASAGHCPLLLTLNNGSIEALSPEGMPLGILPDAQFEEASITLSDCSCAVLYTDGLTEARNAHGEFYGQERLLAWVRDNGRQGNSAVQLSYGFLRDIKAFEAQVSSHDDQTFLVLARETGAHGEDIPASPEITADSGIPKSGSAVRA
jgi:serine phosphatase RsbU (regulator of sigma subunit)/anti-sigma regulatory factor (Ser/Thr protein kinase)